jgi:hypothetical protein
VLVVRPTTLRVLARSRLEVLPMTAPVLRSRAPVTVTVKVPAWVCLQAPTRAQVPLRTEHPLKTGR